MSVIMIVNSNKGLSWTCKKIQLKIRK